MARCYRISFHQGGNPHKRHSDNLKSHVLCAVSFHHCSKTFVSAVSSVCPYKLIHLLITFMAETWVQFQSSLLRFCSVQSSTAKGFPHRTSVSRLSCHSTKAPYTHPSSGAGTIKAISCHSPNCHRHVTPQE